MKGVFLTVLIIDTFGYRDELKKAKETNNVERALEDVKNFS